MPKGLILDAVTEGIGKAAANNISTMKKDAMASRPRQRIVGWQEVASPDSALSLLAQMAGPGFHHRGQLRARREAEKPRL